MSTYTHILVPVDFSEPSEEAARRAKELAQQLGADLEFLHVIDSRYVEMAVGYLVVDAKEEQERLQKIAGERMKEFCENLALGDVKWTSRVLMGVPSKVILEQVGENSADLIVMGTHGRTGIKRAVLGSQTEMVVRRSQVPVLVVHSPGGAEPDED